LKTIWKSGKGSFMQCMYNIINIIMNIHIVVGLVVLKVHVLIARNMRLIILYARNRKRIQVHGHGAILQLLCCSRSVWLLQFML
jgi:hypothetical protein